jgi:tRNA-methyltransferase O
MGMSVVKLLDVQGLVLHVGNCDLLDGTPVLDIKPYIPLYDSFPESRTGCLQEERATARSGARPTIIVLRSSTDATVSRERMECVIVHTRKNEELFGCMRLDDDLKMCDRMVK